MPELVQELLDYDEVQKVLHVGRTTVYRLIKRGELQAVRIGRRTLVARAEIEAFIERKSSAA